MEEFTVTLTIVIVSFLSWIIGRLSSMPPGPPIAGTVKRPPKVGVYIPFIGSALQFSKDPAGFIAYYTSRVGPAFRTLMMGRRTIHIVSRPLIATFFRNSNQVLSAREIQPDLVFIICGIKESPVIRETIYTELYPMADRLLSKGYLDTLACQYRPILNDRMTDQWATQGPHYVQHLLQQEMFTASSKSIFGVSFPTDEICDAFWKMEQGTPLMLAHVPIVTWPAVRGREKAARIVENHIKTHYLEGAELEGESEFLGEMTQILRRKKVSESDIARLVVGFLFATNSNSIRVSFWVIAFILGNQAVASKLQKEVDLFIETRLNGDLENLSFSTLNNGAAVPLMDSIIHETLRLYSMDTAIRKATRDFELSEPNCPSYKVLKGELVIPSAIQIHRDPAHFESPDEFQAERFLGEHGRHLITKLIGFGGGSHMCKGRHFAAYQIQAFLVNLLGRFEVKSLGVLRSGKIIQGSEPRIDASGSGVFRSPDDIQIELTPRFRD